MMHADYKAATISKTLVEARAYQQKAKLEENAELLKKYAKHIGLRIQGSLDCHLSKLCVPPPFPLRCTCDACASIARVQQLGTSVVVSASMCFFEWGRLGRGLAVWFRGCAQGADCSWVALGPRVAVGAIPEQTPSISGVQKSGVSDSM